VHHGAERNELRAVVAANVEQAQVFRLGAAAVGNFHDDLILI